LNGFRQEFAAAHSERGIFRNGLPAAGAWGGQAHDGVLTSLNESARARLQIVFGFSQAIAGGFSVTLGAALHRRLAIEGF
jgi:hypothetical protein